MASIVNVSQAVFSDGSIVMNLNPPTNISGWSIRFDLSKRLGSNSPFYQAFDASGYDGQSGIQVLNAQQGQFKTTLPAYLFSGIIQSGFEPTGNFAVKWIRTDSGAMNTLGEGYIISMP